MTQLTSVFFIVKLKKVFLVSNFLLLFLLWFSVTENGILNFKISPSSNFFYNFEVSSKFSEIDLSFIFVFTFIMFSDLIFNESSTKSKKLIIWLDL